MSKYREVNIENIRTEIPEEMKPTLLTLNILKKLEEKGAVTFEIDSSKYEVIEQLFKISQNVGYDFCYLGNYDVKLVSKKEELPVSGAFLIFDFNDIAIDKDLI